MAQGRAGSTPIALIQQGTTVHQRVITGTLATIVGLIARQEIHAPTLLIVGEVVQLHQSLRWFGLDAGERQRMSARQTDNKGEDNERI